jgi:hypothetical protein
MYAYMLWADTTAGIMKMRNGANSAWISLWELDGTFIATDISLSAGTAGAPSLYFTGDTNTGLFSPGADTVALVTGGTNRVHVTSGGLVGLGTSSPGAKAEIRQDSGSAVELVQLVNDDTSGAGSTIKFRNYYNSALISSTSNPGFSLGGTLCLQTYNGSGALNTGLFMNTAGNVGIGTTTPDGNLTIGGLTNTGGQSVDAINVNRTDGVRLFGVKWDVTSNEVRFSGNTKNYVFRNGSSEAETARIDTSGRLLVGTSSATGDQLLIVQGYAGVAAGNAEFGLRRGGNPSAVDQSLGAITFQNSSGNSGARIEAISAGSWTSGSNHRSYLTFSTTADGAASPTERMRIDSTGKILLGCTSAPNPNGATTSSGWAVNGTDNNGYVTAKNDNGPVGYFRRDGTDGAILDFRKGNSLVGTISVTASATAYNTSSDYRLKENVVSLTGAIDRLNQLQVHRFNFIADPDKTVDGFIAHEAQAVVPECVTGTKDEVDADGNPVYQGIDQSKLVPLLTAALQEALQKIEDLEGRLTAAGL